MVVECVSTHIYFTDCLIQIYLLLLECRFNCGKIYFTYRWNAILDPLIHELHSGDKVSHPRCEGLQRRVCLTTDKIHNEKFAYFNTCLSDFQTIGNSAGLNVGNTMKQKSTQISNGHGNVDYKLWLWNEVKGQQNHCMLFNTIELFKLHW